MPYKFEIKRDKFGEFKVDFRAPNGEVMFTGGPYKAKASVKNAIESFQRNAPGAEIDDHD